MFRVNYIKLNATGALTIYILTATLEMA